MHTKRTWGLTTASGLAVVAILALGSANSLAAGGHSEVNVGVSFGVQLPHGAVAVRVGQDRYYEHRGVYYRPGPRGGYYVTRAPRGIFVPRPPRGSVRIMVGPQAYYRYDDVYYRESDRGYEVVEIPRTVIVEKPASEVSSGYQSVWLGEQEYRYKNGEFFKPTPDGLVWVIAPTGAIIKQLPEGATSVWHDEIEYFEVDDVIFRKSPDGYKVVQAPWK